MLRKCEKCGVRIWQWKAYRVVVKHFDMTSPYGCFQLKEYYCDNHKPKYDTKSSIFFGSQYSVQYGPKRLYCFWEEKNGKDITQKDIKKRNLEAIKAYRAMFRGPYGLR